MPAWRRATPTCRRPWPPSGRPPRPGRIRFVIQSNFNTPGGEPGVLSAQQQLAAYGERRVRLLPEALDAPAYYRHLAEADIALIPYDARRYRERSSGVLVEAMAAGLPVVTSAGSWMETQVGPDNAVLFDAPDALADVLRRAVADYRGCGRAHRPGRPRPWSARPRQLHPAHRRGHAGARRGERPSVLLVMNGDAMVLRNGSSRIARSQLQYLAAAGYAVTGLFLSIAGWTAPRTVTGTGPCSAFCTISRSSGCSLQRQAAPRATRRPPAPRRSRTSSWPRRPTRFRHPSPAPADEAAGSDPPELHHRPAAGRSARGRRADRVRDARSPGRAAGDLRPPAGRPGRARPRDHASRALPARRLAQPARDGLRPGHLPSVPVITVGVQIAPSPAPRRPRRPARPRRT